MGQFNSQINIGRLPYFPNPHQELLLKAALMTKNQALAAHRSWIAHTDVNTLDAASVRLLPLLYQNLNRLGISDAHLHIYKGLYRKNIYLNQLLADRAKKLIDAFAEQGTKTLLLKGLGLIFSGYYKYGERPMSDIDLLVPFESAEAAIRLLEQLGWVSEVQFDANVKTFNHAITLKNNNGMQLDLHWHVLAQGNQKGADDLFWDSSIAIDDQNRIFHILNPLHQLMHICVHGSRWVSNPAIRWVADSYVLLSRDFRALDWELLVEQALRLKLSLPLADTLSYLQAIFNLPIPENAIAELTNHRHSRRAIREYRAYGGDKTSFDNISAYWFTFLQGRNKNSMLQNLVAFPPYLTRRWGKKSTYHLFGHLLRWLYRDLRNRVKSLYR